MAGTLTSRPEQLVGGLDATFYCCALAGEQTWYDVDHMLTSNLRQQATLSIIQHKGIMDLLSYMLSSSSLWTFVDLSLIPSG